MKSRSPLKNILLLVVCVVGVLRGQTTRSSSGEPYVVRQWTVNEGLPQNSINSLLQSSDGYLWLATYGGLVRFDGVRFRSDILSDQADLSPLRVTALAESGDSAVWVGTEDGQLYVVFRGRSKWITLPQGVNLGLIFELETNNEKLTFIASDQHGLLRGARAEDGSDTVLVSALAPSFERTAVASVHFTSTGVLWVGGYRGIARFIGAGVETIRFPSLGPNVRIDIIVSDSTGGLWIGTSDRRVYSVVGDRTLSLRPVVLKESYAFDEVVDPARPMLWAAARVGALRFLSGRFVRADASHSLGAHVKSRLVDREGNIWLGTALDGLFRIRRASFEMIRMEGNAAVTSMAENARGQVFVGQNCGPLEVLKDGKLIDHPVTRFLYDACVWSVFVDNVGRLWVGSWGGGVVRMDPDAPDRSFESFDRSSFVGSDVVLAITQAPDRAMWFGTLDAGVVRQRGSTVQRWTTKEGLPSNDVRVIAFDSSGAVWVGTTSGLALIRDGNVRVFTAEDGIAARIIRTIHVEPGGAVWIGTYGGGLFRWKNGVFRRLSTADGLFDNIVSHFLVGRTGNVWFGSNRGIWRASLQELNAVADGILPIVSSIAYGGSDGITSIETNGGFQPAGLVSSDNYFLFPTMGGIARAKSLQASVNKVLPPVHIESVVIDGKRSVPGDTIQLGSDVEELTVTFTALSFSAPEKMKFRHQLLGYDTKWVQEDARRDVTFRKLDPGSYTFRVVASNSDGVWNEDGAEVVIIVDTPFYLTIWFRALAVLALVGMGMLVVSIRLRQVRLQKAMQEDTSRRLIQSQEAERQRIAGELHDSLGQELIVAKNRVMIAVHHMTEDAPAKQELTQVADALSIALKSVRNIAYNLRPFQLDRLGLTETIRSTVRTVQQATAIVFETEIENIDGLLEKDAEIGLFRIIQEALTNVVKHSEATRSSIVVTRDEEAVVVRIQDNGKGFSVPEETQPSQPYGFGLSGIGERVRLLKGIYKIASTPGSGTTLALRVPTVHRGALGL